MKILLFFFLSAIAMLSASGQKGSLSGQVRSPEGPLRYAQVQLQESGQFVYTDQDGSYRLDGVPPGTYTLRAAYFGYKEALTTLSLRSDSLIVSFDFLLEPEAYDLGPVVLTGTRTAKRQLNSAVIVNIVNSATLQEVQACNLSEGLKFQPGLRVETDCQTCNYTQLRMNGLGGGYSQILINGRPIFSPLMGLYGMEQLPVNMIERIEVVRGGGSALYGAGAIGGTVNVITRLPEKSSFDLGYTYQNLSGTPDHILSGNATLIGKDKKMGGTLFYNYRDRDYYDHTGDNFSEIPAIKNISLGSTLYYLPGKDQKLEIHLSGIYEYRYGGEMRDGPAHLAMQSEERTHKVLVGNIDYQVKWDEDNTSLIVYVAGQNTDREHYTGVFPDQSTEIDQHLLSPPYGRSDNLTYQGGIQIDRRWKNIPGLSAVSSLGMEYVVDDVVDRIDAYRYLIDRQSKNLGFFVQNDWEISPQLNLLTGLRLDRHNLVLRPILSPRLSLLYKMQSNTQLRLTWGQGFRAPQAFDADLHLAFAGGGVSRISLSPDLKEERSNSLNASVNYDKAGTNFIFGYTLDAFYTHLKDAFFLYPLGNDGLGERFEKRNGSGARVQGVTLELRANHAGQVQLESGFTYQTGRFDTPVSVIEGLAPLREFMRTPQTYGYGTLSLYPASRLSGSVNLVYTGPMRLAHFAGAPEQTEDAFETSPAFWELGCRAVYKISLRKEGAGLELLCGVKNLANAYQNDFDSGKNRDSNYVYGPAAPRTYFIGLRLQSR